MRVCPKCNRRFPDNTLFCPDDGKSLVNRVDDVAAQPVAEGAAQGTEETWDQRSPSTGGQRTPGREPSPTPTRIEAPPSMVGPRTGAGNRPSTANSAGGPPKAPAKIDPNNLVGQVLFGEYTISKKLGEGGMGAVYLAQQNSIDQRIAVKVLHKHAAESNELVQRFHREARVVSMLTHPNIIRVFIFGRTHGDLLYLAMEYVEGQDLRQTLDKGMIDEIRALKIMKQLCSGLSEAHDLGVIHRDLKPDNVLLTDFRGESNFVKILDFGIAKLKEPDGKEEQQKLTQAGIVYGTPEYLSPEQAQAIELDHRTDIYSLGVMLYELMTGKVPFRGQAPVQILTAHVFNEPEPPSKIAPDRVTPTMEKIILRAMAKDPKERFQSAMEMFEALVAREQEIVRERNLDGRAGYVPGMEMTGMYHALAPTANFDMDTDATEMMASPPAALIEDARRQAQANSGTIPTAQAPPPTVQSMPQTTTSPAPPASSSTRMIFYGLIAIMALVFMTGVIAIAFLLIR